MNQRAKMNKFHMMVLLVLASGLVLAGCGAKRVLNSKPAVASEAAHVSTWDTPPAYQPQTQIHQIFPGDTLWAISYKKMGSSFLWPLLWKENRDYVVDPDWIEAGDNLELPEGWSSEDLDWAVKLAAERPSKPAGRSFQGAK